MQTEHGLDLPRRLQIEFSKNIQHITEDSGTEIDAAEIWSTFQRTYLAESAPISLLSHETTTGEGSTVTTQLPLTGAHTTIHRACPVPAPAFSAATPPHRDVDTAGVH